MAATSSIAVVEGRAVVARNFPAAWVAPQNLNTLPQKVQSLLQRIGPLDGPPTVSQGAHGLEVIAIFQNASSARDAVQTLHRFDLRSEAEKKAVAHEEPRENERFFVQVLEAPAAASAAPAPGISVPAAVNSEAEKPKNQKRIKLNGVHIWPLPTNWGEQDVTMIATPYGPVKNITIEPLSSGQIGALIDYQKDSHAKAALTGLNGLPLMGTPLRCVMQEEPEPVKPILRFLVYMDELPTTSRPEVEPRLDDREVFLELPRNLRTEDAAREWIEGFGAGIEEVVLMKDVKGNPSGKAYTRFKSHPETLKALTALNKTGANGSGSAQASWSESERALKGTRGPYGLDVLRRVCGEKGEKLQQICVANGLAGLALAGVDGKPVDGSMVGQNQAHFVLRCEEESQAERAKAMLAVELSKIHETYAKEVRGSLVLRGFPASWSEKGLKFVFAPFGGITGAVLEEAGAGQANTTERLAYVKLRNAGMIEKALSNLNKTKVGDGDLVEECVVGCQRWHLQAWSDTFRATLFIDQLAMHRRPLEAASSPEDRELFVKNLPLQDMNRQQIQEYFEGFGEVEDLYLINDIFSGAPNGEGYVRFKSHDTAVRCMDALTPENEAESTELTGWWSESERVLQRKSNCYRFNLIAELAGKDGVGIQRWKSDGSLKEAWMLAETLQQKDRHAPPRSARQLHFVARCADEEQVGQFREILERAVEDAHGSISDRIEKRKRKAELAAAANNKENAVAKDAGGGAAKLPPVDPGTMNPASGAPWSGPPPGGQWPPVGYWGPGGPPPGSAPPQWYPGQAPPPGYPGAPQGQWGQAPAPPGVSVFEQASARPPEEAQKEKERGRSRRRRRDRGADGEERKHGEGGERKRHRHRRREEPES